MVEAAPADREVADPSPVEEGLTGVKALYVVKPDIACRILLWVICSEPPERDRGSLGEAVSF